MRIEELFRNGSITTIFCTSTLIEGVNMLADNLFITNYKKGYAYMDAVDFRNLISRVGRNLTTAIARGMSYPSLDINGNVDYDDLMDFLKRMCRVFKWKKYERQTLGRVSKKTGKHGMLRWYAVILIQWIQGTGLSHIMNKAIEFKQNNPESSVKVNGKQERYNDSCDHRNIVIADTLEVIENVILFSISNYFLRFSNKYKRFHNVETFQNDWYEYV